MHIAPHFQATNLRLHGRVLIIAGSDSGGGAGIQGDLKTVQALGGYGMTAITALTAQNTLGVFGVHPVPENFVAQQIKLCLDDIGADAIKTGMLHSARVIETVVNSLDSYLPPPLRGRLGGGSFPLNTDSPTPQPSPARGEGVIPLVVDPVMVAKGGSSLLAAEALEALKTLLIPRATIITPNLPEAELLLGRPIQSGDADAADMKRAAEELLALGSQAVLLKGGHGEGDILTDYYLNRNGESFALTTRRIETRHTHGTGCALASAIATSLAQNQSFSDAIHRAHRYIQDAIAHAPGLGQGHGPLGH